MKKIQITVRQKSILNEICSIDGYITISAIAKNLDVSSRTILRELDEVEKWLAFYGLELDKKTGLGIKLKGDEEDRGFVLDMLNEENEINIYTPEERQKIIIIELLKIQEPVKLYTFSNLLNVTEGTISHDLDKVEEWLEKNNLNLIRKPGSGIYIQGAEKLIRKAIITLIYENINESELLRYINEKLSDKEKGEKNKSDRTYSRLLYLIDKDTISKLEKLIYELENKIGYRFADNAYIGFIVHLALAIERIRKNEKISMDKEFLEELKRYPEYAIAEGISKEICELFHIDMPKDEIGYITMHIKGSRNFGSNNKGSMVGNFELVRLSKQIIKIAEMETGSFLQQDDKLLVGLVNHMGPAISRMKLGMDIRNPLLQEIKEHYPHLMELGKKSVRGLEEYLGREVPESEIAYIAMHLGAVIEKRETAISSIFKVVIACATGIGTSGLLATRIEKEYDNIDIVDVISVIHIDEKMLKEKGIDFIISTIVIENSSIPVIVVNPLLFKEDMKKINDFISNYSNFETRNIIKKDEAVSYREKLAKLQLYMDAVMQILDNFFVKNYDNFESVNEIIEEVSKVVSKSSEEQQRVNEALIDREKKGGTILAGKQFILIHARVKLPRIIFGIIRIEDGLECKNNKGEDEILNMALIMLVSEDYGKEYMEVMSYLSRAFIEKTGFLNDLRQKSFDALYNQLSNLLEDFMKAKNK